MKRFVLTKPAERDLDAVKFARRVMKDVRKALDLLGSHPGAGHIREDLASRPG